MKNTSEEMLPKGSIVIECGKLLLREKYKVKILNTINFAKSMHYNPFAYIRSEKDILKLVTTLIANTKGESNSISNQKQMLEDYAQRNGLLHLMVKSSVAQNKTNRDTIQLDFLQRLAK